MPNRDQKSQPPISTLQLPPEVAQLAWENRMRRKRAEAAFAPSVEAMQQWELEAHLGRLIEQALSARDRAEAAELKALTARWDEAEALASLRECRKRLGLSDGPIGDSVPAADDDREPLSGTSEGSSGFRPFESPQEEA